MSEAAVKPARKISRPRYQSTGMRQRAWWVIRRRKSFTIYELLDVVATGSESDARGNLTKYVRALVYAGLLSVAEKREGGTALTSPGYFRYHLEIDNGRLAPLHRPSRNEVYDPNNKQSYPIKKGDKDA